MREKAKELQRQRMEAAKKGGIKGPGYGASGGFGVSVSSSAAYNSNPVVVDNSESVSKPNYSMPYVILSPC
jgi:hypothetical protein